MIKLILLKNLLKLKFTNLWTVIINNSFEYIGNSKLFKLIKQHYTTYNYSK